MKLNQIEDLNKQLLLTPYIKHLAADGLSSVSARIKGTCNLTGKYFEMPNAPYSNRYQIKQNQINYNTDFLLHRFPDRIHFL